MITLEKYAEYVRNIKFSQFNYMNEIRLKQTEDKLLENFITL